MDKGKNTIGRPYIGLFRYVVGIWRPCDSEHYNSTKQRGWHWGWAVHQLTLTSLKSHIVYNLLQISRFDQTHPDWRTSQIARLRQLRGGEMNSSDHQLNLVETTRNTFDSPRSKSMEMILIDGPTSIRRVQTEKVLSSTSAKNKLKIKYNLEEPVWHKMLGLHTNYISCQVHVSNTKLLQLVLRLLKGTLGTRIDMKKSGIINKTSRTTWMSLRMESESDITTFCVKVLTAWRYFFLIRTLCLWISSKKGRQGYSREKWYFTNFNQSSSRLFRHWEGYPTIFLLNVWWSPHLQRRLDVYSWLPDCLCQIEAQDLWEVAIPCLRLEKNPVSPRDLLRNDDLILLMEEFLHQLGCIKPFKQLDKLPAKLPSTVGISSPKETVVESFKTCQAPKHEG